MTDYDEDLSSYALGRTSVRAPNLRAFTIVTGLVHLASAIATIVLHLDRKADINEPYMAWPTSTQKYFAIGTKPAGQMSFLGVVSSFFFLSAVFQLVPALITPMWKWLLALLLERNVQPLRWVEYSISASVMFMAFALLNGTFDAHKLVLFFSLSFVLMFLGLASEISGSLQRRLEESSNGKHKRNAVDYFFLHVLGWVPFITLWGITFRQFANNNAATPGHRAPDFVYVLYSLMVLIMGLFGFNQLWQTVNLYYVRVEDTARQAKIALRTEYLYVLLSLTAKSVLAWVLFWGFKSQGNSAVAYVNV
jgi:hypothetical protein